MISSLLWSSKYLGIILDSCLLFEVVLKAVLLLKVVFSKINKLSGINMTQMFSNVYSLYHKL